MLRGDWLSYITLFSGLYCLVSALCVNNPLCMWNHDGFRYREKNATVGRLMLRSEVGYIWSQYFKRSTLEQCSVSIRLRSAMTTKLHLQYQLMEDKEVHPVIHLQLSNYTGISYLPRIQIGKIDRPFRLVLSFTNTGNVNSTPRVFLEEITLLFCTSAEKPYEPDGIVWTTAEPARDGAPAWEKQQDEYVVSKIYDEYTRMYSYTSLASPVLPYIRQHGNNCKFMVDYKFDDCRSDGQINQLGVRLDVIGQEIPDGQESFKKDVLPDCSKDWQTYTLTIDDKNPNATRYQVLLFMYVRTKTGFIPRVRNLRFTDECYSPGFDPVHRKPSGAVSTVEGDQQHLKKTMVRYAASSYEFTSCNADGHNGPTLAQCEQWYNKTLTGAKTRGQQIEISMNKEKEGVQIWTVPETINYKIMLIGAVGGPSVAMDILGIDTEYRSILQYPKLPMWPSQCNLEAKLEQGDKLHVVVGQQGMSACEFKSHKLCKKHAVTDLENITDDMIGGGGAGGGASVLYLERNATMTLLAVCPGGAGMGRNDVNINIDKHAYDYIESNTTRPGYGGSYDDARKSRGKRFKADGGSLVYAEKKSFVGGRPCPDSSFTGISGGFGGGGGACTAGGGGGGYHGGNVSVRNLPDVPGQTGSFYFNPEYVTLIGYTTGERSYLGGDGLIDITPDNHPPCRCEQYCYLDFRDGVYSLNICGCFTNYTLANDGYSCKLNFGRAVKQHPLTMTTIYVIVGVFSAAVLFICFCLVLCYCRGQRFYRRQKTTGISKTIMNPAYETPEPVRVISKDSLSIYRMIGEGQFSRVYEARYSETGNVFSPEFNVAVKKSKDNCPESRAEFRQEAILLSSCDHPNIIKVIGIVDNPDSGGLEIVMDLCTDGSLESILKKHKDNPEKRLSLAELMKVSVDIASACKYLEQQKYVHRDLAARNILLTTKGTGRTALISDFGRARNVRSSAYGPSHRPTCVPIKWMPPEVLKNEMQTTKSDVWSFGILLWEIFTYGQTPYPGFDNHEIQILIQQGQTMQPPSDCHPKISNIMTSCWKYGPDQRPTFDIIYQELEQLYKYECLNELSRHSSSSGFAESLESPGALSNTPLLAQEFNYSMQSNKNNLEMCLETV